eukprot:m.71908 g.71908  ORF g.71908 m.71908 type:complete len:89 (-) comp50209_c0_seq1:27-293(-)
MGDSHSRVDSGDPGLACPSRSVSRIKKPTRTAIINKRLNQSNQGVPIADRAVEWCDMIGALAEEMQPDLFSASSGCCPRWRLVKARHD